MSGKKLYKSRMDQKICGVCGGIAEYLDTMMYSKKRSFYTENVWKLLFLYKGKFYIGLDK